LGSDFAILQETDGFVVVNKPSGVSCYHNKATAAGKVHSRRRSRADGFRSRVSDISLVDALSTAANFSLSTVNREALGIVHRLDRGTSGCMVLAKTDDAHARLVTEFFTRRVSKEYTVLTSPAPAAPPSNLAAAAAADPPSGDGGRVVLEGSVHGRPARSTYRLIEIFGRRQQYALGRVETHTGRKHQVRIHCAKLLQSPIVLDDLYGNSENSGGSSRWLLDAIETVDNSSDGARNVPPGKRFFLHASSLSIPEMGIDVEAPLPGWWHPALDELRRRGSST